MLVRFLNADLELWDRRPIVTVVRSLQPAMAVLHKGRKCGLFDARGRGDGHYANLELEITRRLGAERTALKIVEVIRALPPAAAERWKTIEVRRLSCGYDMRRGGWAQVAHISNRTMAACLRVGLTIEVCMYPADDATRPTRER